jgi:acyl dehydratase
MAATVTELATEPNLTALFARAALRRGHGGGELPDVELARSGVVADRRRLADYDRVCGFRLSDELPLPFPHLLAFGLQVALMTDDAFPFPMIGLVHVANRISRTRPLHVAEPLVVRVRAVNLRPHERGTQFDMVSEASADGEVVWTETSTYLRRTGSGGGGEREPASPAPPTAVWRVPGDTGRRYAEVSGDRNPIHLYPLTARLFGFRGAIAHGMWSLARCLAHYEGRLPAAYSVDVRFKLPILLPATVALSATDEEFALRDHRTGRPHLSGVLTP